MTIGAAAISRSGTEVAAVRSEEGGDARCDCLLVGVGEQVDRQRIVVPDGRAGHDDDSRSDGLEHRQNQPHEDCEAVRTIDHDTGIERMNAVYRNTDNGMLMAASTRTMPQ